MCTKAVSHSAFLAVNLEQNLIYYAATLLIYSGWWLCCQLDILMGCLLAVLSI